jgi:hypothetical protein
MFTHVDTNEAGAGADIRVELSVFNTDPELYMRKASTARRVFVYHDGWQGLFACFGGSLNTSPITDDCELESPVGS